ncbi:hypothetical protein P7C73_g1677, partial [Tremellales sp. Uapishka_1]
MPKVYENKIVYDFPHVHTLNCLHRKYPNPFATHVLSVDTLARTIDPETGILRTERVLGIQQGAPKWISKLFSLPPTAYVREIVFVDPSTLKATCMSVNLSLAQYVSCLELITYTPNPAPGEGETGHAAPSTLFHQRATIYSGFPTRLVARRIEKASVERFGANAGLGRRGFEWVLKGGEE